MESYITGNIGHYVIKTQWNSENQQCTHFQLSTHKICVIVPHCGIWLSWNNFLDEHTLTTRELCTKALMATHYLHIPATTYLLCTQ